MRIDGKKLKAFLDQMDEEADARDKHTLAIRDIVKAAKAADIDGTALRKVHARRRMDSEKRQRADDLIDTYEHALGMAVSMVTNGEVSLRQAAALTGVSKSSIHRALAVPEVSREMTEADLGEWLPPHDIETGELPREMVADDLGDPLLITNPFRARVKAIASSVTMRQKIGAFDPRPEGTPDDLVIPAFLRRTG